MKITEEITVLVINDDEVCIDKFNVMLNYEKCLIDTFNKYLTKKLSN